MSGHTRLYRRDSTYYHRAAVPKDIVATYGKVEEKFSLRTKDYAEALRLVKIAAVEVDEMFLNHRRALEKANALTDQPEVNEITTAQINEIKASYLHSLLEEDVDIRADGFEDIDDPEGFEHTPRPTFEEYTETNADLAAGTRHDNARGKADPFFVAEAEEVLSWEDIELKLSPQSPSWKPLRKALQEAHIEAAQAIDQRNHGDVVATPPRPPVTTPSAHVTTPMLSEALNLWLDERRVTKVWTDKARDSYVHWTNSFLDVVGDHPIERYKKDDAREFKRLLLALPKHWRKLPETRNGTIQEAVEVAQSLSLETISPATINKALNRVGNFWGWAEGHYDNLTGNLIGGLAVNDNVKARDKRKPFSADQLTTLFSSPLFIGCRSERIRGQQGNTDMRDTPWFWLPILSLYSGARLNELCQLHVDDVKMNDEIPHLILTDEGEDQSIKTGNTRRSPLHAQPLAIGFAGFVKERRKHGSGLLFTRLKQNKFGSYSDRMSKDFATYIRKVGVWEDKTSFHSFRHNFEDACRHGGVAPHMMDALQGHSERGQAGRYGKGGYGLAMLKEAMDQVQYPDLDLTHLHRPL